MSEEKRTVKGLFLELRMSTNFEEKILCEELIINMFEDLSKELTEARAMCEKLASALDQSTRQWRMYLETDVQNSAEDELKEDPGNVEIEILLKCESIYEAFKKEGV